MTTEKIMAEFEKWSLSPPTKEEEKILQDDHFDFSRVTFYAGFKAAEQSTSDLLEALKRRLDPSHISTLMEDDEDRRLIAKAEGVGE